MQTLHFIVVVIFSVTIFKSLGNQFGYYAHCLLGGTAFMSIGGGILCLFKPDTSHALWASLQFLAALGPGAAYILQFVETTAMLDAHHIQLRSAIVVFFRTLGRTISVSLAQSVFQNKFALERDLRRQCCGNAPARASLLSDVLY